MINDMNLWCKTCQQDLLAPNVDLMAIGPDTSIVLCKNCRSKATLKGDNWFKRINRLIKELLA